MPELINSSKVSAPIEPYSLAVFAGDILFVSRQYTCHRNRGGIGAPERYQCRDPLNCDQIDEIFTE